MTDQKSTIETNSVIVGASAAGLASAACLKKENIPFILLEKTAQVGSAWRNHYERLHLHTSKRFSTLPYKTFPGHYPIYASRYQVVEYLEGYADTFQLEPRFNQEVISSEYINGKWHTETNDNRYVSENLIFGSGYANKPFRPAFPGMGRFSGKVLHSSDYQNGKPYKEKKALVVGFGNSAGEIAIDLCEHGAETSMSVRSAVNVIPRDLLGISVLALGILLSKLPAKLADALSAPAMRLVMGDLTQYGLRKLPYGPITQIKRDGRIPLLDIGTVDLIKNGRIKVHPGIKHFSSTGVEFVNSTQEEFDVVILATGYHPEVTSFLKNVDGILNDEGKPLISGSETKISGLYFCGFFVSPTGMLREIGIEAKKISKDIKLKLDG